MPVARQNLLVQTRCAVCHTDAQPRGGLSLEHYDAARPEAGVAGMMAVKVTKDGAMSAAGAPTPDRATTDAFVGALSAAAAGPTLNGWNVSLTVDPGTPERGHSLVTARRVQAGPDGTREWTLTCNGATHRGETGWSSGAGGVPYETLGPILRQLFSWCLEGSGPAR